MLKALYSHVNNIIDKYLQIYNHILIIFTMSKKKKSLNYLMGFRAASRPLSLSNCFAFNVFFFFWFHVYAVILRTFARGFDNLYDLVS